MNIAILGHGVVGGGVAKLIFKNKDIIEKSANDKIEIKKILDLRDFHDEEYKDLFTKSFDEIVNDESIDIVVEAMGGVHPAYDFAKDAILHKKSFVTSNKEMVAQKGAELLRLARENDVNFLFEASVGGAIPVIKTMYDALGANHINEAAGILNGTTNFILTKMIDENMGFNEALSEAQKLGYAEADPTADIEGHDACRKIAILSSILCGSHVYPDELYCEGITKLSEQDIKDAAALGCVVKLIARAKVKDGKVEAMVSPAFISAKSPFAAVNDSFNAVMLKCDAADDIFLYGRGAGRYPTASAVVADVIDIMKAKGKNIPALYWEEQKESKAVPAKDHGVEAYVRLYGGEDAEAKVKVLFGGVKALYNKNGSYAFVADGLTEGELSDKLSALNENGITAESVVRILNY